MGSMWLSHATVCVTDAALKDDVLTVIILKQVVEGMWQKMKILLLQYKYVP